MPYFLELNKIIRQLIALYNAVSTKLSLQFDARFNDNKSLVVIFFNDSFIKNYKFY